MNRVFENGAEESHIWIEENTKRYSLWNPEIHWKRRSLLESSNFPLEREAQVNQEWFK